MQENGEVEFNFNSPSPKARNLEEAQQIIDGLWSRVAELKAANEKLASEITDVKEKLNTNSSNSSKAPSSDLFKKPKEKLKQHGPGKNQRLKQGAQPGHQGKGRELLPVEEVNHTVICLPISVCQCGGHVKANTQQYKRHQQFELPKIKPIVTEYQQIYGDCIDCGQQHCGDLPLGIPHRLLGPRATASIGIFTGDYRLSKRATQQLFDDVFGLTLSLGTVSNSEKIVSAALSQPVEEVRLHIKEQAVVNADETSHKQQGQKMWMWMASTLLVSVFIIRNTRCMQSAKDLLGEAFAGILITDRYAAYNWIKISFRQFCWAHLIRDFQKISERSGVAGKIGDDILSSVRRMFRLWRRLKAEEIDRQTFQKAMIPIRKNIEHLLTEGTVCGHTKTEKSCKHLLKRKGALWAFVDNESVEPTNNLAEQQLRTYVLWRKSSFGTQSERGNSFVERMMTTTATCKLQKRNRYDFITQAVAANFRNEPPPSLLPVVKESNSMDLAA